jgi:DNA-binding HxlR family transcriptional regulator
VRWSEIGTQQRCSVARTLSVVGERWTMLILRDAFRGIRRFDDLSRTTGAPRPLLAERLRTLTDEGVLVRRRYSEQPDRYEYRLTEKGLDLHPVVISLMAWGDRWMDDGDGPPVTVEHRACGSRNLPGLACPDCGGPVTARDLRTVT